MPEPHLLNLVGIQKAGSPMYALKISTFLEHEFRKRFFVRVKIEEKYSKLTKAVRDQKFSEKF